MIEEKLQKCRVDLQKKKLKKSGENKFAKFKYFELADFIPTVNEMFNENKMFSNFSIQGEVATLTITDCEDKTSQTFTSNIADADVKGCTAIQSLGAVHTYLKRYLYLNALEIVENDALDASVGSEEFTPKKQQPKKQVKCGATTEDAQIYINVAHIDDLESLRGYYEANKEYVKDKKAFYDWIQDRRAALIEIREKFGGQ